MHIFFPLLIVNLCLYLYFKEKAFFNRYKIVIFIVAVIMLLLYAVPVLAQEKPGVSAALAGSRFCEFCGQPLD